MGSQIFGETPIYSDGSLLSFLRSPETFSNHITIVVLEMYATVKHFPLVEQPTDTQFDLDVGDTTYLPSLNLGFSRVTLQQQAMVGVASQSKYTSGFGARYDRVASMHYRNIDQSMHNREIGGKSKDLARFQNLDRSVRHPENPGTSALVGGSSNQHHSAQLESIDRRNDIENNPMLTQPTKLVNNNNVANDDVNELDNNIPLDYEGMDDNFSPGGDGDSDKVAATPGQGPKNCASVRVTDHIRDAFWNQKKPGFIRSDMLFQNKLKMKDAVSLYSLHHRKESVSDQFRANFWRVICKCNKQGCRWMIHFTEIPGGMWKAEKMIAEHSCTMDASEEVDHSNLRSNMIAIALIPSITINPYISIKDIQVNIKRLYKFTPSERKASRGRKRALEMGEHQSTTMQGYHIFKYLFWAFKPSIDGFKSCRPVISIDSTDLYGKYEMKLLIAMGIDANNNNLPLAYALVARESYDSWSWFLRLLFVIDNKLGLFLSIIKTSCSVSKHMCGYNHPSHTTENQLKKFRQRMEQIKTLVNIHLPLAIGKKFKEYTAKAQRHTDCMIYNTENAVFEIRTFADADKGGNVHVLTGGEKKCEEAHWPPSPFNLLAKTKYERTEGVQYIAPSRMGRRCGNCKQTGHNRTRCPKNP
ncbi:hypothetical protein KY284_031030 [Solanum tuberosum]|nr:hypothetical protein KY284_031030 [Solanum tuberosum]